MATYTAYQVTVTETAFEVSVKGHTTSHPLNWSCVDGLSLERVKDAAAEQALPVVFIDEQGSRHDHGIQFTADAFERAAYRGYAAYGYSMTDGHYAPVAFDAWVVSFREFTEENLRRENDFYPAASALEAYLTR